METAEKECGALGGLFQAIVNDMKVTGADATRVRVPFGDAWRRQPRPAVSGRPRVCVPLSECVWPLSAVRPGLRVPVVGGVGTRVSGCPCGTQGPCPWSPGSQRPLGVPT